MSKDGLPLKEVSISELYITGEKCTYEIPIYQRNYAWGKDEITALVQDVYDAFVKDRDGNYYIGTLVSYHKGGQIYEVIDGQQRLTTIWLILEALSDGDAACKPQNRLTYKARKKSDQTLKAIPNFDIEEKDSGIESGFKDIQEAIGKIVSGEKQTFTAYFLDKVHIVHYQVPRDIDLNHYFEIMNSRGEQLEKHEIVKAKLMQKLHSDQERQLFHRIWECCSEMSVYVQQNIGGISTEGVFGQSLDTFIPSCFETLLSLTSTDDSEAAKQKNEYITIEEIINPKSTEKTQKKINESEDLKDSFQPIIDFSNFLLIVLKLSRISEVDFSSSEFNLDDKELLKEFDHAKLSSEKVKEFAFNLLKARFYLDNYIVHHAKEEDTIDSNPWKLQVWYKDEETKKAQLRNLCSDPPQQNKLVHLLSMFEVAFTARQRKNYLFYCLLYLMNNDNDIDLEKYTAFAENLADKYFYDVYLDGSKLNAINTPVPGSFDEVVLVNNKLNTFEHKERDIESFNSIYGDGSVASKGIPLFIFNYLDYKIWKSYDLQLRGSRLKEGSGERENFFGRLGCPDFGLKVFEQFYFSRTRRSLEHYYPQANATGEPESLNQDQINCLGNYAMIGSAANSSGSNWSPKTKLDHYLDSSGKIGQISVASLKFMVMLQTCHNKQMWKFNEIQEHQNKMLEIMFEAN